MAKKKKTPSNQIAANRKARHDYSIEENFEAGLSLMGWEVKSLRAGRIPMAESYILVKDNELWWFGGHIRPLISASTHVNTDPTRTRKLLMHRTEIDRLIGQVERKGYTLVPLRCTGNTAASSSMSASPRVKKPTTNAQPTRNATGHAIKSAL